MSETPQQPDEGKLEVAATPLTRARNLFVKHRMRALVGAMGVALVASAAFTVARPTVTSLVAEQAEAQAGPSQPPSSITLKSTEREGSVEPGRNNISAMRQQIMRVQAKADRHARIINSALDVKVAYFNMLGCYHTDHDEPHYGHLAFSFASCGSRMPRQYHYLDANGITIAGVGEFQGKAWRVLAGINGGRWGIYPRGQSGPNGQNPVVWRSNVWDYVSGEQISIPYNTCGNCRGTGTSSLVLLKHKLTGRQIYVLNTHHTSNGGGFGAGRRSAARSIELGRINAVRKSGIPVLYMGDFNDVGPSYGHISQYLEPAFSGMGIDKIWGTPQLAFTSGGYDGAFRGAGLTDHGSGIAIAAVTIPGVG